MARRRIKKKIIATNGQGIEREEVTFVSETKVVSDGSKPRPWELAGKTFVVDDEGVRSDPGEQLDFALRRDVERAALELEDRWSARDGAQFGVTFLRFMAWPEKAPAAGFPEPSIEGSPSSSKAPLVYAGATRFDVAGKATDDAGGLGTEIVTRSEAEGWIAFSSEGVLVAAEVDRRKDRRSNLQEIGPCEMGGVLTTKLSMHVVCTP